MRLGILRMVPIPWEPEKNMDLLETMARKAAKEGVEVLVTCECFTDGYCACFGSVEARFTGEERARFEAAALEEDSPILARARALCAELHMGMVLGCSLKSESGVRNAALFWDQAGQEIGRYCKTHLYDHDLNYIPGDGFPVFDTPWGKIGLLICADRRWPETSRALRCQGAQIILIPTYGMRHEANTAWMRTRAYENECFLAFCHPNVSFICNPEGDVEAYLESNVPGILVHDIAPSRCTDTMFSIRRTDLYGQYLSK